MAVEPISAMPPHRVSHPVMRQSWRDLCFLHWRYSSSIIRRLVPPGLEVDLYDGSAWVGLVPFVIADLTLPKAPALPWISSFPETNLRTYVVDSQGRRGVWFFSLDAGRLAAVAGARAAYALPYFWARMQVVRDGTRVRYSSARHLDKKIRTEVEIAIGDPIDRPSELEVFLTARFRLYAQRGERLLKAGVEHPPWRLRGASMVTLEETLTLTAGLPAPASDPLVHFGGSVDVMVGAAERVTEDEQRAQPGYF